MAHEPTNGGATVVGREGQPKPDRAALVTQRVEHSYGRGSCCRPRCLRLFLPALAVELLGTTEERGDMDQVVLAGQGLGGALDEVQERLQVPLRRQAEQRQQVVQLDGWICIGVAVSSSSPVRRSLRLAHQDRQAVGPVVVGLGAGATGMVGLVEDD